MTTTTKKSLNDNELRALITLQVEGRIDDHQDVTIKRAWNDFDHYKYDATLGVWECVGGGRNSGGGILCWGKL